MNATRDSGFSESIVDDTNFDFNGEKIGSVIPTDAIFNEGVEDKQQTDLLLNVEQILITIIDTIVQAEIKENKSDNISDDNSKLTIDVNIHKSFEEIVLDSKKDEISFPEIKSIKETSIKLDSENVTNQINNHINTTTISTLHHVEKKSKKSKSFIKNIFSRIKKPNKKESSVKILETVNQETSEFPQKLKLPANNNSFKKEDEKAVINDLLDNEQKIRVQKMRNKVIDVIVEKLRPENFSNETIVRNLVSRSIDLIRNNKIQSFTQLADILKKEFFMINDEITINKLASSLEDLLMTKRILKDLDLQPEKYEVIMFPCDFEPQKFQAKSETKQVSEVSTTLNEVKVTPAPESNFKSPINSSKFSWAMGLDSSPGSNKIYENQKYVYEKPNESITKENKIESNSTVENKEEKGTEIIFNNLRWFEANEKLRYYFYRSIEMSSKVKYSEENNLFSILIKTR